MDPVEQTPPKSEQPEPDLAGPGEKDFEESIQKFVVEKAAKDAAEEDAAEEDAAKQKFAEEDADENAAAKKDQYPEGPSPYKSLNKEDEEEDGVRPAELAEPPGKTQYGGKSRRIRKKQRGCSSRRSGTVWTDLVKRVFNKNKHRSGYKFKHALMDAKKIYRGVVVEPGRVGPGAAKKVATSISKTIGKFADKRIGIRTRRRGSRRGGRR